MRFGLHWMIILLGKKDGSQRRDGDTDGKRLSLPGIGFGLDGSAISDIGASVAGGIGVDDFAPSPAMGHAEPPSFSWHGGGIQYDDDFAGSGGVWSAAAKGECAGGRGICFEPGKAAGVMIGGMQCGEVSEHAVEVTHERLHPEVVWAQKYVPIEGASFSPFAPLA